MINGDGNGGRRWVIWWDNGVIILFASDVGDGRGERCKQQ